jgi:predicted CxxxxCH...CXXCH cytochrome family protein
MHRLRSPRLAVVLLALACGGEARRVTDAASGCSTCHGDLAAVAPLPVGAHRAHVQGGAFGGPYGCEQCHPVPAHRLHADGRVNVAFGAIAGANGAPASWDPVTGTCSGTWCHGRPGRAIDAPGWNAGADAAFCGSCHGLPPGPPHPAVAPDGCRGGRRSAHHLPDLPRGDRRPGEHGAERLLLARHDGQLRARGYARLRVRQLPHRG